MQSTWSFDIIARAVWKVASEQNVINFKEKNIMAIELNATIRTDLGKGASRRLRRAEQVPAVITGGKEPAISITLDAKKVILAALKDEFYSETVIVLDGQSIKVKPVEIQRHPVNEAIIHVDFLRI